MPEINPEEIFPIVDENGRKIGEAPRKTCHDGKSMLLHPVVHLHLFNSSGKLFLQMRSSSKDIQPGKWDTSVGGHVAPGESVEEALLREANEEIGIKGFDYSFLGKYIWESSREREFVEGRFWSKEEIINASGKDIFTPNFEREFQKFFSG
jgi:isopentenyldiphosphate isomerase